eukprot:114983_1
MMESLFSFDIESTITSSSFNICSTKIIGKKIIANIAKTKHETNTKCKYSDIDEKKFYALWGIQFCCRQMANGGKYFMTNLECVYNVNTMTLTVHWLVLHKTKKGTRSANRPLI